MKPTTTVRLAAALLFIFLAACGKNNSTGNNGTNNVGTNNVGTNNVGTNNVGTNNGTNGTNNDTTNVDYDCEPNLTGEVDADSDLQAAGGPQRYRYEWHRDSGELTVDLLAGGSSTGELTLLLGNDNTSLEWEDTDRAAISEVEGTFTTADGETAELVGSTSVYWDGGYRTVGPGDIGTLASPIELQRTTLIRLGEDELIIDVLENGPADTRTDPRISVKVESDAPPPTVGRLESEVVHEENGFRLQHYYRLTSNDTRNLSEEDFQQFLDEAGVGSIGTSEAVLALLQTLNDFTWQQRAGHHLATCVQGAPIPFFLFNSHIEDALSCYGSFASAGRAVPALAACVTVLGCIGPGIELMTATYEVTDCICKSEEAKEYFRCGGPCNPITCGNTCYDIKERMCSGNVEFFGGCVLESETDFFGYCHCEFTILEGGACDGGDPHIRTWDRRSYSPQVPGEFIAARSEQGDFELQVRHRPIDSQICAVAEVHGVAMRWGDHRFTVLHRSRTPNIWIDGVALDDDSGSVQIADRLVLEWLGGSVVVHGPNGTLYMRRNSSRIDMSLTLTDPSIDDVEGLFGTRDGDPADDVRDADGNVYGSPMTLAELVEQTTSWQVTAASSLFDYDASESVDDFFDPDYIPRLSTVDDLPMDAHDDALQACMDAGITDPIALDNCVLDVGCTGDDSYAEAHVDVDHVDAVQVVDDPFLEGWTEQGQDQNVWRSNVEDTVATHDGMSEAPSFFVSDDDRENFHYRTFIRPDAADDDVVGVVFGYRAPIDANGDPPHTHDMFVFGWKQTDETDAVWGDASEGMYLAHVHGQAADVDEAASLFWSPTNADPAQLDVIATNFGAGTGYTDGFDHAVDVVYSSTGIRIDVDGATVFDVPAATLPQPIVPGRFGFFTLSQGARFGITTAGAAPGFCDSWGELEEVPCAAPIDTELTLDGQRMSCPADVNVTATLTMVNGSVIEVGDRMFVRSGGSLNATGTSDCPVMITSDEDQPAPGDIRVIDFAGDSLPSSLEHVVLEYAGNAADSFGALDANVGSSVALNHVTFRHLEGPAVRLGGNVTQLSNLSFTDVDGPPLRILPDAVTLIDSVTIDVATTDVPVIEIFDNETLTVASRWPDHGVPYFISGDLTFAADLELGPGVELLIGSSGRHWVEQGGSINAKGTAADPVVIQSAAAAPAAGDWRQIYFRSDADPSEFHYAQISHAGSQGFGALRVDGTVTLDNVTFSDNQDCDVSGSGTVDAMSTTYVACP